MFDCLKALFKGNKNNMPKAHTTTHYTVQQAAKIKATESNTFPPIDVGKLTALLDDSHVWDNWMVLDEDGLPADLHGFRVIIALIRPNTLDQGAGEKIGYFFSSDKVHYEFGGFLFDVPVFSDVREWSGSTFVRDRDGFVQTFYTISTACNYLNVWQTKQRFATAIQEFDVKNGKLKIIDTKYHEFFKEPDGVKYETAEQASEKELHFPTAHSRAFGSDQTENHCFRDPKFYRDPKTGKAYVIFEGNTGPDAFPSGVVDRQYVGTEGVYQPSSDELKANGCVGVIELTNDDYTFGVFRDPWLTTNLVTDEIERINVVYHQGHTYLFVVGHGNKFTAVNKNEDLTNRDFMLGFRADTFLGKLTPMNESGVVVQQKSLGAPYAGQMQNQQYVYSWLLVPTETTADDNVFDCLSYANYSVNSKGETTLTMTAGPTISVKINGLKSEIVGLKYNILAKR